MPKDLFLMRHAKSSWKEAAQKDFDRPLNKRGLEDLQFIADWFKRENIIPDVILSSSALRARATVDGICDIWGLPRDPVQYLDRLYLADRSTLMEIIQGQDESVGSLLIVAHNPGLERVLSFLVADPIPLTKQGKLMTTANVAHLRLAQAWRTLDRDQAELLHLVRPKVLREKHGN